MSVFELSGVALLPLAASAFSLSFLGRRFVLVLKDRHPAEWERLRKPDFRYSSSIGGFRAMVRLVRSSEVAALQDVHLRKWQRRTTVAMYAYFTSASVFLLFWGIAMGRSCIPR